MRTNLSAQSIEDERAWILVDSDGEEVIQIDLPFILKRRPNSLEYRLVLQNCFISDAWILCNFNSFSTSFTRGISYHAFFYWQDEDPANTWLYIHENDIVAILTQFPLAKIFSHILQASMSESGEWNCYNKLSLLHLITFRSRPWLKEKTFLFLCQIYIQLWCPSVSRVLHTGVLDYDVRRCSEPVMLRLFSFCTVLVELLGSGLETYSMARYRQLNKRLGKLIRSVSWWCLEQKLIEHPSVSVDI